MTTKSLKSRISNTLTGVSVISRNVYITDRYGRRIREARWGKWMRWNRHNSDARNVREAVEYADFQLMIWGVSTVVYVKRGLNQPVPVYQAKQGIDGSRYRAWKSNPLAEYWRRRV